MTAIASPKRHHHPFPGSPIISHHPPHHKQQLVQPAARNHYVNVCPDLLPPPLPPPSTLLLGPPNTSSREPSISDSEISTSSISGLSDSSEIRALFASLPSSHGIRDTNLAGGGGGVVGTTANNPHYNQLKVVEGSKVSERTRRILHRPSYLESDSSSSLAESSESLGGLGGGSNSKQTEKDHYDRLKLNLENLSGNKRAISGLRVLYRDPPRGYRHFPTSSSSPSSPTHHRPLLHTSHHLTHQRGGQGIFGQKFETPAPPRTKYWSEGHSNKIHSVNPDPIRSKSLSWQKNGCSTASTADSPSHGMERGGTPTHSTPVFRRRSLSETLSYDVASTPASREKETRKVSRKSSRSTDNLSHMSTFFKHIPARRSFSARGRMTQQNESSHHSRERAYTEVVIGGRKRSFSRHPPNSDIKRCGSVSGRVPGGEIDHDRSSGSINFTLSPVILKYDGEELEYRSDEHDFSICIPKGALKKRATVEIQVGLAIHGPFTFSENSTNVSPILWLCSIPDTKFKKPITITLPHCIADARPGSLKRRKVEDSLSLHFTSASLKSGTSAAPANKSCGKRQFEFSAAEGDEVISSSQESGLSGSISTKQLSPLCIVASIGRSRDLSREMALHAVYCIVPVLPAATCGREWNLHFCITFNLHTCVQGLRSYFSESEFQIMPPHPFKFAPPASSDDDDEWGLPGDPELEIRFPRQLPESGWSLLLESDKKIPSSAVSFSPCRRSPDHTLSLLTSSLTSSLTSTSTSHCPAPPAMFTVAVDGTHSERAAVTCVSFVGSVEPVMVKVTLPLDDDPHHFSAQRLSEYDHLPLSSTSSMPHTIDRHL